MPEEEIFPKEVTFKVIFRNNILQKYELIDCLSADLGKFELSEKESSHSKFASFTITAVFNSDDQLKDVCGRVAEINGFMTMF